MCAHAVSMALQKVDGVEDVKVSLNQGLAAIRLKPGNSVTLQQIEKRVRDSGFTPRQARVAAGGDLVASGGKFQLKVVGTGQTYALVADPKDPKLSGEMKARTGKAVLIEGTVPAAKNEADPRSIEVTAIQSTGER